MAWPLRLRVTSFVVILAVVMLESAIALIPIGAALIFLGGLSEARVFTDLTIVAATIALAIGIHGDLGRQGYRKWWRLGG